MIARTDPLALPFRKALVWATGATVAGSLVSVAFAARLVDVFQGKGLLSPDFLGLQLLVSVAAAGAVTISLATVLGMPTSTTHALTGAWVGAGIRAAGASGWKKRAAFASRRVSSFL